MQGCVQKIVRQRLVLAAAVFVIGAQVFQAKTLAESARSTNFLVSGGDRELVIRVARAAEDYRKTIAIKWLGKPLPNWTRPCPVKLRITNGEAGGVTSFAFDNGRVTSQEMTLEGSPERIIFSALPHEVTHTIFAWHFGSPMPRWADEGACMLSEDVRELARQDGIVRNLLAQQKHLPLKTLFAMEEYPRDLLGFYGQGYSVSRFLIEIGGREKFLTFVGEGGQNQWDEAVRKHYHFNDTKELDRAWKSWLRVVANQREPGESDGKATLIAMPGEPKTDAPVIRAQSGNDTIRR